jgi:hypothetical protein
MAFPLSPRLGENVLFSGDKYGDSGNLWVVLEALLGYNPKNGVISAFCLLELFRGVGTAQILLPGAERPFRFPLTFIILTFGIKASSCISILSTKGFWAKLCGNLDSVNDLTGMVMYLPDCGLCGLFGRCSY